MGNKEKGANAERELIKMFTRAGFRAARVAGSGVHDDSPCDLIAGNVKKKFAIECKALKKHKKYLDKTQIEDFLIFSEVFGLKPILALRFNREGWFFVDLHKKNILEEKGKSFAISLEMARKKGKKFGQIFY